MRTLLRPTVTRRAFLATTSAGVAVLHLGARQLLAKDLTTSATGNRVLPEPMPAETLRTLAARALEAAKAAGATYADVRVADQQWLAIGLSAGSDQPDILMAAGFDMGIRVLVDGAMGFVYRHVPNIDAAAAMARDAVASARGFSRVLVHPIELVPAPALTGEWSTPMRIDPFTVPVKEQADVLGAWQAAAEHVKYGRVARTSAGWTRETRVFASTEGALLTQQFVRLRQPVLVSGVVGISGCTLSVDGMSNASGGYEVLLRKEVPEQIVATTEEAVHYASLPYTTIDVGRYDVITTGAATAALATRMLGPAFELDRALGEEVAGGGTTYAMPPGDILGTPLLSPHVSLRVGRTAPTWAMRKWDDEGVECMSFPVIERGQLVDYYTTRHTVGALQSWYAKTGRPLRSNGSAIAPTAAHSPAAWAGDLMMAPSTESTTVDDLCRGVTKGILIHCPDDQNMVYTSMDQQLMSAQTDYMTLMLQLEHGRPVRRVGLVNLQMATKTFWGKSLKAIGGAATLASCVQLNVKGIPSYEMATQTTAPAAHFTDVNVIRVGG